ncbi:hypothetical protein LR010_03130 [Candidatus Gracilibacteria bacterium]|nr:hypothetical protein [Candidatus Gracilibacteria bacterium]
MQVLYATLGAQITISLLATGEINLGTLLLSIPTGLMLGRGISKVIPKSPIETTVEGIRESLIDVGGSDLGGMRRILSFVFERIRI